MPYKTKFSAFKLKIIPHPNNEKGMCSAVSVTTVTYSKEYF